MNIWPSPGKGLTRYYEFTQRLSFKCTTFTSPNIPCCHQLQGLCTCCYIQGENFFFLTPWLLLFSPYNIAGHLHISDQSTLQSHCPWISSRYKITYWEYKPQVQLHICFQFWKWTRASFLDSGPYNSRGLSGFAQDRIFSIMLNNWHTLGTE